MVRFMAFPTTAVICLCAMATGAAAQEPVPKLRFVAQWGEKGEAEGQFHAPIGIAANAADQLYVTDARNNRVQKFSGDGKLLAAFPVDKMPGGVAIHPDGSVYVAAMMGHKVCVFDDSGKLVREWGKQGQGDGEFDQPGGLAFAPDGTLYVADQVNRRVQRFKSDGTFRGKWGEYGKEPGQFDGVEKLPNRTGGPNFVAVDANGDVYTTEAALGRIQKFSPEMKPVLFFGNNSVEAGGFGGRPTNLPGPIAVVVDRKGRIWVSSTNNRIQCFASSGTFLGGFTSLEAGRGPGQFSTPHGMAFDSEGHLYVVDTLNQRIQKFAVE